VFLGRYQRRHPGVEVQCLSKTAVLRLPDRLERGDVPTWPWSSRTIVSARKAAPFRA